MLDSKVCVQKHHYQQQQQHELVTLYNQKNMGVSPEEVRREEAIPAFPTGGARLAQLVERQPFKLVVI